MKTGWYRKQLVQAIGAVTWFIFLAVSSTPVGAELPQDLTSFLENHCLDCHGASDPEAGLDLESLRLDLGDAANLAIWVNAHDRVQKGEMPPSEYERLDHGDQKQFVDSLAQTILQSEKTRYENEGRTVYRRLNRAEYEYTLRDLLKLPNLQIRDKLPPDQVAYHFNNQAAALELSYVHMSRYLDAADQAIDTAIRFGPKPERQTWATHASDLGQLKKGIDINGARGLLRQTNSAQTPFYINPFQPAADGRYRIKVEAFGFHWNKGKVEPSRGTQVVSVYASPNKSVSRLLHAQGVSSDPDRPTTIEFDAFVRSGERLFVYFSTLSQLNGDGWKDLDNYEAPGVAVGEMSMEGPFFDQWPPASQEALFDDLPVVQWKSESGLLPPIQPPPNPRVRQPKRRKNDPPPAHWMIKSDDPEADARRLLTDFMSQACRGPVDSETVERCVKIVVAEIERESCFQDAMRAGYKAALCSPAFLFFREMPGKLNAEALAARLSYFLWKSIPDDELLLAARRGEISNNDGIRRQVDRMLADPRSDRLIEELLGQWLDLNRIGFTQPDKTLYPEFDDFLRDSMIEESHATFRHLLEENRPARELIDSDEVVINGRLAEHYGIPEVEGVELNLVKLPAGSPRGGFMTQGAVLTVTANGTNTSPVTRGAWVLDRLLGTPPPKPPSDVPAIEPDIEGATTIREQLAQHRDYDACRSCHAMIDPPGFALESFDVMGAWRDRYRSLGKGEPVKTKIKNKKPAFKLAMQVDSTGQTADGKPFEDIHGFKQLLLEDERQIARNVVERLTAYATGSTVGFADREEVEAILDRTRHEGYRLRDLLVEVVASPMFQNK